mgnify:CR=1 FL=1
MFTSRRDFLQTTGCGFGYLAWQAMAQSQAALANPLALRKPHHQPKAKRVIFLFMQGGVSHVDSYDYKPRLFKDDGKIIDVADSRAIAKTGKGALQRVMKPLWDFQQHGETGHWASNLFPHINHHIDDLCFLHGMHTEGVAHGPATLFLHTGTTNFKIIRNLNEEQKLGIDLLGAKDHALPGNELDASDRDNAINIRNWPVKGLYQPDAIASYKVRGQTYYLTANEGDDRNDFIPGEETRRVSALATSPGLDPAVFGDITALRNNAALGRLTVTAATAPRNALGQLTELQVLGGRSFSIRDASGALVFDSGSDFERITAARYPLTFNASNDNNNFDDRSDNKGPEPEGVVIGAVRGRTFAFIGLERIGGVMIYDITDPAAATFVDYVNNRDFTQSPTGATPTDNGPEGLAFIEAKDSPTRQPLLVIGNEVSGTTTIYSVDLVD